MDSDWRVGRSVTQCNLYMLQKEESCDVTFVVGPSKEKIRAHKYMLISRSAVFHSKLTTGHGQLMEVQVPDVEPDIFKRMLMFIYTEDFCVDNISIIKLLQAANKYKVEGLKTLCLGRMKANLSRENVCHVLRFVYDDNDVETKTLTLDYFMRWAGDLKDTNDILELPKSCLEDILKDERLTITEEEKYKLIVKWAEHECRKLNKDPTDENKQQVLGPLKNLIKYTRMSMPFFASTVSVQNILSKDEVVKVFQELVNSGTSSGSVAQPSASNQTQPKQRVEETSSSQTRGDRASLPSSESRLEPANQPLTQSVLSGSDSTQQHMETDPRSSSVLETGTTRTGPRPLPPRCNSANGTQPVIPWSNSQNSTGAEPFFENGMNMSSRKIIARFGGIVSGKSYLRDNADAISLISSHSVKLHGIYLFGSHQRQGLYKIKMQIQDNGVTFRAITPKDMETDGKEKQYLLKIDPPVQLQAENVYTFKMVMKGPTSFYGRFGKESVREPDTGVTFTFIPHQEGLNGTNTDMGQFPAFVFELDE